MPDPKVDIKACKAVIFGLEGPELTRKEAAFFACSNPFGFILFARNVDNPAQMRKLTAELRAAVGRQDVPILIDQEGGRVQRLRPPHWREAPAQAAFGSLYEHAPEQAIEALALNARLMAAELHDIGVNVNCTPCLDLKLPATSSVIGDRAFSADPALVARLGRVVADTLLEQGIMPVIKHLPGHGRALVDSHFELPVIRQGVDELAVSDFAPFADLADVPWGMTAHIVFSDLDAAHPVTQSRYMIDEVIRGRLNFAGLLLSDDINMQALSGDVEERASRSLAAGCDVALHCSGELEEMIAVDGSIERLSEEAILRIERGQVRLGPVNRSMDIEEMKHRLDQLMQN